MSTGFMNSRAWFESDDFCYFYVVGLAYTPTLIDLPSKAWKGCRNTCKSTRSIPRAMNQGVSSLSRILEESKVPYETAESAPGRGNLWAKLEGGDRPALVLPLIDVVPANRKYWSFDPLSGEIKNGYVYGRGAIDTKGLGIAQLQAFSVKAKWT